MCSSYFCDPRSAWQRGKNMNAIGVLRQCFLRGTGLDGYSQADPKKIAIQLN
jgi:IS30 family transposase